MSGSWEHLHQRIVPCCLHFILDFTRMNTRSNLDLHTTPISELQYESSGQQVKSERPIHSNAIENTSTINSVDESDNNIKKQAASFVNWEEIRETEQQRLKLIKVLTKDEMINIDQ